MQLHRIEGASDWADVPLPKRNIWQHAAAATSGILTPGNIVSLLGLASIPWAIYLLGIRRPLLAGVVLVLGRACDLLDGYLADKTGTKSRLGEAVDATFDKLSGVYMLVGLGIQHTVAWMILVLIMVPHILISMAGLTAFFHKHQLHPSPVGKISMAIAWMGLVGFVLTVAAGYGTGRILLRDVSYGLVIVSIGMALAAFGGYAKEVRGLLQRAK